MIPTEASRRTWAQRVRDRWYAYLLGPIAVLTWTPIVVFTVIAMWVPPTIHSRDLIALWASLVYWVSGGGVAFIILWTSWVVPWLDAGNRRMQFNAPPDDSCRLFAALPWVPCVFVTVIGLFLSVLAPASDWLVAGRWTWGGRYEVWGVAILLVAGAMAVPIHAYQKRLHRRFMRTIQARQLCFACGYDLRGNPAAAACPECGHPRDPIDS